MFAAFPSFALVRRELLTLLRGPRAMAVVFLFAAAASLFVWGYWPEDGQDMRWAPYLAQAYVVGFVVLLFLGTLLCVPAFAAGAIVLEREQRTFELLRMTLAWPSGVIFSKLINATGFFLLLMIGLAPVFGTIFFFVGFDVRQLAAALFVVACTAVTSASIGLLCSAFARRTLVAIGLSYLGLLAAVLIPISLAFIAASVLDMFGQVRSVAAEVERVINIVMPTAVFERVTGSSASANMVPHLLYQAAVTLLCLLIARRLVARPQRPPKIELRKPVDDAAHLRQRRRTWPYYLVDPLRRKKPIEDGRNAMLVREIRWGLINRGSILVRIFYVAATIYFFVGTWVGVMNSLDYESLFGWFLTQITLTVIVAPALTANTVTKELELGNIDMLRMTLLRPWEVVTGKFVAAVFSVVPVLIAAVVSVLPIAIISRPDGLVLLMGYGTLMVCTGLSLSIAIFFSTALRRTLPAIIWSYLVSACVFVGFALAAIMQGNYASDFGDALARRNMENLASPVFALNRALELLEDAGDAGQTSLGYWATGMALWTAVAAGLLGLSVYLFARHGMRDR